MIVNCTGLGAKAIFSDPELMPLKGQLVVLIPQAGDQLQHERRRQAAAA